MKDDLSSDLNKKSIEAIQEEIISEFETLKEDREMSITYLMELGNSLSTMDENEKKEENLIKGCQAKVWLSASLINNKVILQADSTSVVTKGLISLLVRIFSYQDTHDILHASLTFPHHISMEHFIGTQRSNGFAAMLKQIKHYALAFTLQQKKETKR